MRIVSLFSGVGALDYSALSSIEGSRVVFSSEIDKYANKAYEIIYGHKPAGDITLIDEKDVPEHDLLIGGFPCQAFSMSGKRLGFEDTRGTLFFDVARILRHRRPKYFVLENVKGLLSHNKGETLNVILHTLEDLGYRVEYRLLNSKHFNSAQSRERVVIVGSLDRDVNLLKDIEEKPVSLSISDILEGEVEDKYVYKDCSIDIVENNRGGSLKLVGLINLNTYKQNRRVFSIEGLAPTVDTCGGGHTQVKILLDGVVRKMTPLEYFRLQSIPDLQYRVLRSNGFSDTQLYKLAGNAVSVNMFKEVFKRIEFIENGEKE